MPINNYKLLVFGWCSESNPILFLFWFLVFLLRWGSNQLLMPLKAVVFQWRMRLKDLEEVVTLEMEEAMQRQTLHQLCLMILKTR